jgi:hypothetical protein
MEELNLLDPTGPTFEMMAEEDVDFRRMMESLDTLLSEATGALFHGPIPGKRSKPIHQRKKETPTIDRRVPVNAEPFCLVGVTDTVVRTESLWRLRKKDERDATLYWSSFFTPAVYSSGLRILLLPRILLFPFLFYHKAGPYDRKEMETWKQWLNADGCVTADMAQNAGTIERYGNLISITMMAALPSSYPGLFQATDLPCDLKGQMNNGERLVEDVQTFMGLSPVSIPIWDGQDWDTPSYRGSLISQFSCNGSDSMVQEVTDYLLL